MPNWYPNILSSAQNTKCLSFYSSYPSPASKYHQQWPQPGAMKARCHYSKVPLQQGTIIARYHDSQVPWQQGAIRSPIHPVHSLPIFPVHLSIHRSHLAWPFCRFSVLNVPWRVDTVVAGGWAGVDTVVSAGWAGASSFPDWLCPTL